MKRMFLISMLLVLSGCASQAMQSYVGHPVQEVMLEYGPPANAFDMPDKTRVFQWKMEDHYTAPTRVNTYSTGNTYGAGNSSSIWMSSNSTITGGETYSQECLYSMFAKWNKSQKTYIITGFKKPDLMCE